MLDVVTLALVLILVAERVWRPVRRRFREWPLASRLRVVGYKIRARRVRAAWSAFAEAMDQWEAAGLPDGVRRRPAEESLMEQAYFNGMERGFLVEDDDGSERRFQAVLLWRGRDLEIGFQRHFPREGVQILRAICGPNRFEVDGGAGRWTEFCRRKGGEAAELGFTFDLQSGFAWDPRDKRDFGETLSLLRRLRSEFDRAEAKASA